MNRPALIFGGFLLGVGFTVMVTSRPSVAPWYSQTIYDCGIRIAGGVSDGTMIGFNITGSQDGRVRRW